MNQPDDKPEPMCRSVAAAPTPMTDERLREIEGRLFLCTKANWIEIQHAQRQATSDVRNDSGAEVAMGIYTPNAAFIAHARQDVPDLVAEVRRAKLAGADAVCKLIEAKGLLLERARQAEELIAVIAEQRAAISDTLGALHVINHYASHIRRWLEDPNINVKAACETIEKYRLEAHERLVKVPKTNDDAINLQSARRKVVEKARAYVFALSDESRIYERERLDDAVVALAALEKLEGPK